MRAALLEPIEAYPGNKLPWKSKCLQCGETVSPSFSVVRNNGGGCRKCGLRKAAKSRRGNELEAIEFMKKSGALPLEPYQGSNKPWLCRCLKCNKEITPTLGNVKNNRTSPCVYCSKKKVHPDDAIAWMLGVGLEPLAPYPGSNKRWKCRHLNCGEIVYPTHSTIISGQGGCLKCGYAETKRSKRSTARGKDGNLRRALFPREGNWSVICQENTSVADRCGQVKYRPFRWNPYLSFWSSFQAKDLAI